jgi:hypothetical protein
MTEIMQQTDLCELHAKKSQSSFYMPLTEDLVRNFVPKKEILPVKETNDPSAGYLIQAIFIKSDCFPIVYRYCNVYAILIWE